MGLDIRFEIGDDVRCPHCGTVVGGTVDDSVCSGGRAWYPILEKLGYYVPYDKRTEENDWYGKDMVLTEEQVDKLYHFVKSHSDLYYGCSVLNLLARAKVEKKTVTINADW